MFKIELDLLYVFSPPMTECGNEIKFTRTIELPFAPTNDISIFGRRLMEEGSHPEGFPLKDVT